MYTNASVPMDVPAPRLLVAYQDQGMTGNYFLQLVCYESTGEHFLLERGVERKYLGSNAGNAYAEFSDYAGKVRELKLVRVFSASV